MFAAARGLAGLCALSGSRRKISKAVCRMPKWLREGRPLEEGAPRASRGIFSARLDPASVASLDDVRRCAGERRQKGGGRKSSMRAPRTFPRRSQAERGPAQEPATCPEAWNLPFVDIVEHGKLGPALPLATDVCRTWPSISPSPSSPTCGLRRLGRHSRRWRSKKAGAT